MTTENELSDEIRRLTDSIQALSGDERQKAEKALLSNVRTPSMAGSLSAKAHAVVAPAAMGAAADWLKATLPNAEPGSIILGLMLANGRDADEQREGKALLSGIGLQRAELPDISSNKAVLGATGATGGYVLPNNLVDSVQKPQVAEAIWSNLVSVRNGVAVRGVDQPYRTGAPARMTFQDWGVTKENVNEAYGTYTAALGTLARIIDIGKQYARFSAGAAEADVMDELGKAAILGENYYILAGAGTGIVGSGDPTTGIYTSLNATPTWLGYKTAFAGASASTIAGSAATGLSQAFGTMATRSRFPTAVVMDAVTYFAILAQGSDTAGFWLSPASGGLNINPANGQLRMWTVPIYWDPNFNTNTGTTKAAIAIDGPAFRFYRGLEFRIDSTDQAGTRWDQNLIGYRGEEEIGFNADTAVHVGAAQLITALIA